VMGEGVGGKRVANISGVPVDGDLRKKGQLGKPLRHNGGTRKTK